MSEACRCGVVESEHSTVDPPHAFVSQSEPWEPPTDPDSDPVKRTPY